MIKSIASSICGSKSVLIHAFFISFHLPVFSQIITPITQSDTLFYAERSYGTFGTGFFAYDNAKGFVAGGENKDGFVAIDNKDDGFVAVSNGGDAFFAAGNDGYAAFLTSPSSRPDPAVFISHGAQNSFDLHIGGDAIIKSDDSYFIYLNQEGSNDGENFKIFNRNEDIIFGVADNGLVSIKQDNDDLYDLEFGGNARIKSDDSYFIYLNQEGVNDGENFKIFNRNDDVMFGVSENGLVSIKQENDALDDMQFGGNGRIGSEDNFYIQLDSDNSTAFNESFHILNSSGTSVASINEGGNADFSGNVCADNITCSSDRRYKKNIIPLTSSLTNLSLIYGVKYDWDQEKWPDRNFSDELQIGFIAQELEEIYPELVYTDDDGYKSVAYNKMTAVLVEAVKELSEKVIMENEALKSENEELKQIIDEIEARVSSLEKLE